MIERTDDDGRWESVDGLAWVLVEPSQAYLDRREQMPPDPAPPPDPLEVLAAIGDDLAMIGPSSTSTALRTALLNVRATIDQALG